MLLYDDSEENRVGNIINTDRDSKMYPEQKIAAIEIEELHNEDKSCQDIKINAKFTDINDSTNANTEDKVSFTSEVNEGIVNLVKSDSKLNIVDEQLDTCDEKQNDVDRSTSEPESISRSIETETITRTSPQTESEINKSVEKKK